MRTYETASIVLEYIESLPSGAAVATTEALDLIFGCRFIAGGDCLLGDEVIDYRRLFDLDDVIERLAAEKGIVLDSSYCAGVPMGLPYNISRIVLKDDRSSYAKQPHFLFHKEGKHAMTWFHLQPVVYAKEYGAPALPKLADLVSDTPDPYKDVILDYLGMHCIAACPGIHYDIIDPKKSVGSRSFYADDKYYWTDCFANYVRKYNIPVPADFRAHILASYKARKIRHARHRLLKKIILTHEPNAERRYSIAIDVQGNVHYENSSNHPKVQLFSIDSKEADYIVHPITESLFCYDTPPTVPKLDNGYRWSVDFYNAKGHACKIEGWPGEPKERYASIRRLFEFIEQQTGTDLGTDYMNTNESIC